MIVFFPSLCALLPPSFCLACFPILEYLLKPAVRLHDSRARQRPDPAWAAAAVIFIPHIFILMVYLLKECSSARVIVLWKDAADTGVILHSLWKGRKRSAATRKSVHFASKFSTYSLAYKWRTKFAYIGFECKQSRVNKLNLLLDFNQILLHLVTERRASALSLQPEYYARSFNKQTVRIQFRELKKEMANKNWHKQGANISHN